MHLAPADTPQKTTSPVCDGYADDALWSSRCWFWRNASDQAGAPRAKRQRETRPLVLSGFGVSLRIEGGTLRIRNGFTHHPQKPELFRFFRGDLDLPERIVLLDCTGSVSFDVLSWLSEQGVALIKLSWEGEIVYLSSPRGYAANPYRVEWQRQTRSDPDLRMAFCNGLIIQKIESTIDVLEKSLRRSPAWETAMQTAYAMLTRLEERPPSDVGELRGLEGTMAAAYFRAWAAMFVRWRKRSRHHIPPEWRTIGSRSSGYFATGNRNAHHPINAILNYAYTVLETETQTWAIAEGYDPKIGIMHESRLDASAFVFDVMEPQRALVDRKVLQLVKDTEFDPADFVIRSDGVCRLNPDLARRIVQLVIPEKRSLFGIA